MGLALAVQDSRQRHRPRCAEQKGFGRWSLAACGCRQKPDSPKAATGERCSPCVGVLRPLRDTAVRATTQAATGHIDGACFTCPFLQRDSLPLCKLSLLFSSNCFPIQPFACSCKTPLCRWHLEPAHWQPCSSTFPLLAKRCVCRPDGGSMLCSPVTAPHPTAWGCARVLCTTPVVEPLPWMSNSLASFGFSFSSDIRASTSL